ncbi:2-C-methyl-D-erythritol 2,4-cyclodiphosphate synthase [Pelagibacterales bacterium SAG-MED15]|nr:2-C-methyl-D-erythritol 2,4-cyclodiphosphate synthase [Pelagibacterales bacterium SAG-MED15]
MNNCFILLAAGQSKRFKSSKHKQFASYRNKLLYEHSIIKALKSKLFSKIIIVTNNVNINIKKFNHKIKIIKGGKERSDSSLIGLKYAKKLNFKNVLIHDAARPDFSINLLKKIVESLKKNTAVVPYVNSFDSIKYIYKKDVYNLNREKVLNTQTPQAFRLKDIYELSKNNKNKVTDEASLFIEKNLKVKFIKGEKSNNKITYINDIKKNNVKFGIGFDVHRLVPNKKLYLGGLRIKSKLGTLGHSDGDPVLHAITDAILGACGKGDIGQKFSDKSKKFKNIRSTILLKKVIDEVNNSNYSINNLDINIITQTPKISKYKNKMINIISRLCNLSKDQINIKGKTAEKLGVIGKEKAIACEVIASVNEYD